MTVLQPSILRTDCPPAIPAGIVALAVFFSSCAGSTGARQPSPPNDRLKPITLETIPWKGEELRADEVFVVGDGTELVLLDWATSETRLPRFNDLFVQIVNVPTGDVNPRKLQIEGNTSTPVVVSADELLISVYSFGVQPDNLFQIHLYDLRTGERTRSFNMDAMGASALARRPGTRHFVSYGHSGEMTIWDMDRESALKTFRADSDYAAHLLLENDGVRCYSVTQAGALTAWNLEAGEPAWSAAPETERIVTDACLLQRDGVDVVTGEVLLVHGSLSSWDASRGVEVWSYSIPAVSLRQAESLGGGLLLCGSATGELYFVDRFTDSHRLAANIGEHVEAISVGDSGLVVVAGRSDTVHFFQYDHPPE